MGQTVSRRQELTKRNRANSTSELSYINTTTTVSSFSARAFSPPSSIPLKFKRYPIDARDEQNDVDSINEAKKQTNLENQIIQMAINRYAFPDLC